jgi:hypothetical protein
MNGAIAKTFSQDQQGVRAIESFETGDKPYKCIRTATPTAFPLTFDLLFIADRQKLDKFGVAGNEQEKKTIPGFCDDFNVRCKTDWR